MERLKCLQNYGKPEIIWSQHRFKQGTTNRSVLADVEICADVEMAGW